MNSSNYTQLTTVVDSTSTSSLLMTSSCNQTNSSTGSNGDVAGNDVIVVLWRVFGPILLLVGVIGNILVLVTMTRRRMLGTSTSIYLVGMAAIDLVVIFVGMMPAWLEGTDYIVIKVRARMSHDV